MDQIYTIQEIVKGCQQHKASFQKCFVERYSGFLYGICKRYIKDQAFAKDLLQESLFKILDNFEKYDPAKGKIESWISTITIRQCLKHIQKNGKLNIIYKDEFNEGELSFDPEILDQFNLESLMNLIHQLPELYKAIFNLFEIDGYSHAEISKMLNIKESTSRVRLSRAKLMLKGQITNLKKNERWIETV